MLVIIFTKAVLNIPGGFWGSFVHRYQYFCFLVRDQLMLPSLSKKTSNFFSLFCSVGAHLSTFSVSPDKGRVKLCHPLAAFSCLAWFLFGVFFLWVRSICNLGFRHVGLELEMQRLLVYVSGCLLVVADCSSGGALAEVLLFWWAFVLSGFLFLFLFFLII